MDNDTIDAVVVGLNAWRIAGSGDDNIAQTRYRTFGTDKDLATMSLGTIFEDIGSGYSYYDPDHYRMYSSDFMLASDISSDGDEELIRGSHKYMSIVDFDAELTATFVGWSNHSIDLLAYTNYNFTNSIRPVAVVDIDAGARDTMLTGGNWRPEFIITKQISTQSGEYSFGMEHLQSQWDADDNFGGYTTESMQDFSYYLGTIAGGDFDGDAIRVGPPTHFRITDIVRPMVILNAPPVHFDVFPTAYFPDSIFNPANYFDSTTNDSSFRAVYSTMDTTKSQATATFSSDHSISNSLSAEITILKAKIGGSLKEEYGDGFSKTAFGGASQTISKTRTAKSEDMIYAVWSSYISLNIRFMLLIGLW